MHLQIKATMYLALTHTQAEINRRGLSRLVPTRRFKYGSRPQISRVMDDEKGDRWKWGRNVDSFSEEEKRTIMGHVVETMVMATFKNHFYKWDGQVRRQRK